MLLSLLYLNSNSSIDNNVPSSKELSSPRNSLLIRLFTVIGLRIRTPISLISSHLNVIEPNYNDFNIQRQQYIIHNAFNLRQGVAILLFLTTFITNDLNVKINNCVIQILHKSFFCKRTAIDRCKQLLSLNKEINDSYLHTKVYHKYFILKRHLQIRFEGNQVS